MADAKEFVEWDRASTLAYLIAAPNRDPQKESEPFTPAMFNPFELQEPEEEPVVMVEDITLLGKMLGGG